MRTSQRAYGLVAGVQALLWAAPIIVLATGGDGIPSPGSLNDPSHALAVIAASPDIAIVTTVMCTTGAAQVVVVLALADRLTSGPARLTRISTAFGIIAAAFLMIDGALGMAALPQLAHLAVRPDLADAGYLATVGIRNGIDRVISLTLGMWALTANWAALRRQRLSRSLAALGLLVGVTGIVGTLVPAAGTASIILLLVWTFGFAGVLLRKVPGTVPEVVTRTS
ncbi:MAG TPA: hypothetical protein VHX38_40395 [Pseudonocardiaceae bacterium]|jgi:hypothetical protein|nr:hypothetical protein [Pseudonocardiaceae bacterium]